MVRYWSTRRVASPAPVTPDTLTEAQLGQWKLLGAFQRRPAPQLGRRRKTLTEEDPRRTLFAGQYVSLLLFGWLNPVLKTTRALCAASHFERLQAESQGPPVSLASFSAMQQVVEPELLERCQQLLDLLQPSARLFPGQARELAADHDVVIIAREH